MSTPARPFAPVFAGPSVATTASATETTVVCYDAELRLVWTNRRTRSGPDVTPSGKFCPVSGDPAHCGESCPVARAHASGHPHEVFVTFADGRVRRIRAEPLFDPNGRPGGVVETIDEGSLPGAEGRAADSLTDLSIVLDALNDAIFVQDPTTGAVLHVNQAACRMYGYTREALVRRDVGALSGGLPPHSQADALAWLARARAEGPQVFEWQARRAGGELFWAEIGIRFGRLGGTDRCFVTVRDISKRKAAEERVRISEANFRCLLASIHEAVYVQDEAGCILDANLAGEALYGLARAELLGRSAREFAAPGNGGAEHLAEATRLAFAGAPQRFDCWVRCADGSVLPREASLTPGLYSGARVVIAVLRDISERKQLEAERERTAEALRASEERFRLLLGRVPTLAIQGYRADGVIHYWNEASVRLYGYTAAEAIGSNLLELIIPAPMREEVRKSILQMAASGQPLGAAEMQLQRKDGTLVPVFSSHAVVHLPGGTPELYCLDIDLTERKHDEQQRLDLERRLLNAQKLESLGGLAGGIAHDFNNLLTGVLGNLELALLELAAGAPARPLVDDAIFAARRAAGLTQEMLAYAGRQPFQPRDLDLNDLIREHAPRIQSSLPKTITLHLELAAAPPLIEGDAGQLQQIMANLVTNAAEAVGRHPGTVVLRTGREDCSAARLAASRLEEKPPAGPFVYAEVLDTGCGMDAATQQRLFDPFFSTKFAGRGLGMAVVLGIMRVHRGALFVESSPGQGTAIRALFPAVSRGAPTAAPHTAAEVPAGLPPRLILVVDDEEPVRKIAQRMGRRLGLEVLTAADGETGLDLFRTHAGQISCVIVDLTMPTMDGLDCLRSMRAIQPNVPSILSSGFPEGDLIDRYAELGLAGFLQKPFTSDQFAAVIRQAVAGLP